MKKFKLKYYLILLILFSLCDCGIGGFIGFWREWYWQALSNKQFYSWLLYLGEFSIAALLSCLLSGYGNYIGNILGLYYRTKLTKIALTLNNHPEIEGGSQRVQEDCNVYPQLLIQLSTGLFKSVLMIGIFILIIFIQLPWYYVLISLSYALLGTFLASKIASPLIKLNYLNQVVEAKFRQILTKINYKKVHNNNRILYKNLKYLQYFQSFYNQITIIIPHILLLFVYFSGKISFGVFMQVASSIAELINNLSFFINSFDQINKLLSCRKRLKELEII